LLLRLVLATQAAPVHCHSHLPPVSSAWSLPLASAARRLRAVLMAAGCEGHDGGRRARGGGGWAQRGGARC
jgi:hypothetical protein